MIWKHWFFFFLFPAHKRWVKKYAIANSRLSCVLTCSPIRICKSFNLRDNIFRKEPTMHSNVLNVFNDPLSRVMNDKSIWELSKNTDSAKCFSFFHSIFLFLSKERDKISFSFFMEKQTIPSSSSWTKF